MTIEYIKRPEKHLLQEQMKRVIVTKMLEEIEAGGEQIAAKFGRELDGFDGEIVIQKSTIEGSASAVPQQLREDIHFALDRVTKFARAQLSSIREFEIELSPGLWAGQKMIPIETAGCYVPGGRYAHVASAIMSIATAKVAGVKNIIACTAPNGKNGPNPAIVYAMNLCGADTILALGGVQGIAAMAFGLFTQKPARILVGPGNRFVAEAKRMLYGRVGIDMFAGPTEIAIIADETADAEVIIEDLVSQAEHGPDSPAWLITDSVKLANEVIVGIDGYIAALPKIAKEAATAAWRDYGEVILCENDEEMASISDEYAAEHLEVQTAKNEWFEKRLKNYGSLFVGEETTVTYGTNARVPITFCPPRGCSLWWSISTQIFKSFNNPTDEL